MNLFDIAINEILKTVDYMINKKINQTTKIYTGIILSNNNDGKWNIQYNGEIHSIAPYGNTVPTVGTMVKVFIPQGNQALAFFI